MNNEPVAWMEKFIDMTGMEFCRFNLRKVNENYIPLYTAEQLHPADLTDEEIDSIANDLTCTADKNWNVLFARAILRKAQEK